MGIFDDSVIGDPGHGLATELIQALHLDDSSQGGMFDKSYVSGYEYYAGMHIGVCHGPVDAVKQILFSGKVGWQGRAEPGNATWNAPGFRYLQPKQQEDKPTLDSDEYSSPPNTIFINQPKLFGGEKQEGGVLGLVDVMHGGRDQGVNSYLKNRKKLGSKNLDIFTPAYRGILSLVFHSDLQSSKEYVPEWWLQELSPMLSLNRTSKLSEPVSHHTGFYWGAMNPALKEVAVMVFRALEGWNNQDSACWYHHHPSSGRMLAVVTRYVNDDHEKPKHFMNAAHIAVQCLTDLRFGMKVPMDMIGDTFKDCALQLSDQKRWVTDHWENLYYFDKYGIQQQCEGIGLGVVWSGENSIRAFLADIMRYINGNVYIDHTTGKLEMVLVRQVPEAAKEQLPTLGPSQIIDVGTFSRPVGEEAINTISLTYRDYETEKTETVTRSNTAMVAIYGEVISESVDMPGLKNPEMAAEICERIVRQRCSLAGTYSRMQVTKGVRLNGTGVESVFTLYEGAPFLLDWPKHNVSQQVYRVSNINYGSMTDNFVEFDAIEDVFGLVDSKFIAGAPPSGWDDFTTLPVPLEVEEVKAFHVPYTLLLASGGTPMINSLPQDAGLFGMLANTESSSTTGFSLYSNSGESPPDPNSLSDPAYLIGSGALCPTSALAAALPIMSTEVPGTLQHTVKIAADSMSKMSPATIVGAWFIVDDEKIRCVSIIDNEADPDYLLMTLERGIYDTIPAAHLAGAKMWWFNGATASAAWASYPRYSEGEILSLFAVPYGAGGGGALDEDGRVIDNFSVDNAWFAPYPPANVKINGQYFPATTLEAGFTLEWACRNRVSQSDVALPWDAAGVEPEPGTTFTVRVYDPDIPMFGAPGTLLEEVTDIDPFGAVGYYIYDGSMSAANRYAIELLAVRNGKESTQTFVHTTSLFVGYGMGYGYNYSGSPYAGVDLQFGETPPVVVVTNPSAGTPRPAWAAGDWVSLDATVEADGGIGYTAEPSSLYDFVHYDTASEMVPTTFTGGSKPYNHRLQCSSKSGSDMDSTELMVLSDGDSIWKRRLTTTGWVSVPKPSVDIFSSPGTVDSIFHQEASPYSNSKFIVCMNKGADIYTSTQADELMDYTRHGTAGLPNELADILQAEFITRISGTYISCGKYLADSSKTAIASSSDLVNWTLKTTEAPKEALDNRNWVWFAGKFFIFSTVGDAYAGSVYAMTTTNGWTFNSKSMGAPSHTPVIGRGFAFATSTSDDYLQVFAGAYVFTSDDGSHWNRERSIYAAEQVLAAMASPEPFIDSWPGNDNNSTHLESRGILFRSGRYLYDETTPAGHPGKVFLGALMSSKGFHQPFVMGTEPQLIQPYALPYSNMIGGLGDSSAALTNAGFDNGGNTADDVYGFIGRKDSGKWYFEVHVGGNGPTLVGVAAALGRQEVAPVSSVILSNTDKIITGIRLACPGGLTGLNGNSVTFSTMDLKGAVIGVSLDLDTLSCNINFNDESGVNKTITGLTAGLAWFPVFTSVGVPLKLNLGQDLTGNPFQLTVPGGYSPWLS